MTDAIARRLARVELATEAVGVTPGDRCQFVAARGPHGRREFARAEFVHGRRWARSIPQ